MSCPRSLTARTLSLGVAAVLTFSAPAFAASNDFIVESASSGGTTDTAKPYLEQFSAYAQRVLTGWKPIAASFFADKKAAGAAATEKKPGFAMMDIDMYLDLHKREDLTVIAAVEGAIHNRGHLHVLVKDPAIKTLEDLKGKVLVSNHLQSPRYISKLMFAGKIDAETFFKLQPSPSPLRGMKSVDRGEAAATIVDDAQLANMKSLPYSASLRTIFSSGPLPPTPFVAFGKNSKAEEKAAVQKMLLGMCADKKGAEVCKALQVTKFAKPDLAAYEEAKRRFDK